MQYNQPYGAAANAPYVNGDPSIGRAGSIPPAASIENPQREIVNLITDAGLATPADADLRQLGKAIQSMKLISADDTGTVNNYSVTLAPVPTAYFKYMTVVMLVSHTSTGPSVVNVNALGNKNIKRVDGSAIADGELILGSIICLIFDGINFLHVWSSRQPGQQIFMNAPKTLYVNGTTGNDTFDGFQPTVSGSKGPFATIQHACDVMATYNNNGFDFTISVADYTAGAGYGNVSLPRITGSGKCHIVGNIGTPANCLSAGFVGVGTNGLYWIRGFKIVNPSGDAVSGDLSGTLFWLSNIEFGACSGPGQIVLQRGASGVIAGAAQGVASPTTKISGSCPSFIVLQDTSTIAIYPQALTLVGTPNFVSGFMAAVRCATANAPTGVMFSSIVGTATGLRFVVASNAVIDTAGSGLAYFPGSIAGTTPSASGGQYL